MNGKRAQRWSYKNLQHRPDAQMHEAQRQTTPLKMSLSASSGNLGHQITLQEHGNPSKSM